MAQESRVGSRATTIDTITKSMEHTAGAQDSPSFPDLAAADYSRPALTTLTLEGENSQVATVHTPNNPEACKTTSMTCGSPNILSSRNQTLSGDPSESTKTQLHGMENVSRVNEATLNNVTPASSGDRAGDAEAEGIQQANDRVNPIRSSTHSTRRPSNSPDAESQALTGSRRSHDQVLAGSTSLENRLQPSAQNRPFESTSCSTTQAFEKESTNTVTVTHVVGEDASPSGMAKAVISASQFSKHSELEDEDVNELGRLVIKHRDYKMVLQSAQSKFEECRQQIDDLEKSISCEQLVVADVRQRIETLQEEERIKQQLIREKHKTLETEVASLQEFTTQAEVVKTQMSEIWVKLGL